MAPKRRPRRYTLGDARMEVAVDHLAKRDWGFDEKIVRKVAGQLLQEYDVGDAAWSFIEENNYDLLIKGILEYQESNDLEGSSAAGNKDESTMQDETPNEQALGIPEESPNMQEETPHEQAPISGGSPVATAENETQDDTAEVAEGEEHNGRYQLMNEAAEDADETRFMLPSPVSEKAVVIRPRRPCYGWIVDDDKDEDEPQELLELTPAGEISRVISVGKTEEILRKRKSLWDLKPDDP